MEWTLNKNMGSIMAACTTYCNTYCGLEGEEVASRQSYLAKINYFTPVFLLMCGMLTMKV
jgi:hypothetical protein